MTLDGDSARVARRRVIQVFRYLEALNQHRNPAKRQIGEQPWVLWFRDLPSHPDIARGVFGNYVVPSDATQQHSSDQQQETEDAFVLKVRRPSLTKPPTPPDAIADWLEHGWEDPAGKIVVRNSLNEKAADGASQIVEFSNDIRRVKALEVWQKRRDEWAQNELPARETMRIFERLYELYGRIGRESERVELVLGDGVLSWRRPEGDVHHPVLLQRVQLTFNPSIPQFVVIETEHEPELYTGLFLSIPEIDPKLLKASRDELEVGGYHPLGDDTSGFLRSFVQRLSPRGEFLTQGPLRVRSEHPVVCREPVLFLRARILGFATALEAVLEDLQGEPDLPGALLNIVGIEHKPVPQQETGDAISSREQDEILFSKHSNPEQFRIAERLEQSGSVLVQGPPGTGKTHTIANLIGHLLAHEKSVLVTAHTTKALRVLREHVVEQLRPLCISVLESDLDSRKQLEDSVARIVERLSREDASRLEAAAENLAKERRRVLTELREARKSLLNARADEYRDIVVAGQAYSPADAARMVSQGREQHGWIPGPVTSGTPLPLTESEVGYLYQSNETLTPEDETELLSEVPEVSTLLPPEEFERILQVRTLTEGTGSAHRADLWDRDPGDEDPDVIKSLAERLRRAVVPVAGDRLWKLAVASAGQRGGTHREPWELLLRMIDEVGSLAASAQESIIRYNPKLSAAIPLEEHVHIADEICGHLSAGGKLGGIVLLVRPAWKRFVRENAVATGAPTRAEHFRAIRNLAVLQASRRELRERWSRQLSALGAPAVEELGSEPERACSQYAAAIGECLDWYARTCEPLLGELKRLGFRWEKFINEQPPQLREHGEMVRLRDAVSSALPRELEGRANVIRVQQAHQVAKAMIERLDRALRGQQAAQVTRRLRDSASAWDRDAYRRAFEQLLILHEHRAVLRQRNELLGRLEQVAPSWVLSIRTRLGQHGQSRVPGNPESAWLWRLFNDELERRNKISLEDLQQRISRLEAQLHRLTAELVDHRAWAGQVLRTNLAQRKALVGWLDTIKKIGKGTGVRAKVARLRAEASRLMGECRSAVPVWIMPLSRVAENFDPRRTRFDVVIVDEASQSDVMALLALYLGRKVVVVGDNEQVSPSAVGQEAIVVLRLIDEHLQGIPNAHLYDGQTSVYDLGRQSFAGTIVLLEHFRCVPDIIQFSNWLSYEGRIKPLRDATQVSLKPHVIAYRVGGSADNHVNVEEAYTVASLMVAAAEQPEYVGKTFGAVSLVGEEQALEIQRLLLQYMRPDEYERRGILCGTAAQFQGDERHVMFLSVVDSPQDGPLSLREQLMFKQRFNVAASRAQDQMWVIHSLDPRRDLKPGDLRRRLIEHAEDPFVVVRMLEREEQRVESPLEQEVLRRLVQVMW